MSWAQTMLFYVFAAAAAGGAIAVVLSQNVARMAFWLIVSLGSTAGLFFLLDADFVGTTQLLVYVGGTLVLLIFGVMLTASGPFISIRSGLGEGVLSGFVGAALLGLIIYSVNSVPWNELAQPETAPAAPHHHEPMKSGHAATSSSSMNVLPVKLLARAEKPAASDSPSAKSAEHPADHKHAHDKPSDKNAHAKDAHSHDKHDHQHPHDKHHHEGDHKSPAAGGHGHDGHATAATPQVPPRPRATGFNDPNDGNTTRPLGLSFLGLRPDKDLGKNPTRLSVGYLLPFEIASVHLLVVLIGAAYLARAKRRKEE